MTLMRSDLAERYADDLRRYLSARNEEALAEAYALGRRAITDGAGILDVAAIHHEAILQIVEEGRTTPADFADFARAASSFYTEVLAPFEITHRGFTEATEFVQEEMRFSAVLTHELLTPITSIMAAAGMLQDVVANKPDSLETRLVSNITDGINNLNARANELIELVRLQSGVLAVELRSLDVGPLVERICGELEPVVLSAGMKLETRISKNLPPINGDASRLRQVLANLIQNGIRHASDGERLVVIARRAGPYVSIRVRDYGEGIAEQVRSRLFEPGFHLFSTPRRNVASLGIGLRLCHFIVRAHGGSIAMKPARDGGSEFEVRLPSAEKPSTNGDNT